MTTHIRRSSTNTLLECIKGDKRYIQGLSVSEDKRRFVLPDGFKCECSSESRGFKKPLGHICVFSEDRDDIRQVIEGKFSNMNTCSTIMDVLSRPVANRVGPTDSELQKRVLDTLYRFAPKIANQKGKALPFMRKLRRIISQVSQSSVKENIPVSQSKVKRVQSYLQSKKLMIVPAETKESSKGYFLVCPQVL